MTTPPKLSSSVFYLCLFFIVFLGGACQKKEPIDSVGVDQQEEADAEGEQAGKELGAKLNHLDYGFATHLPASVEFYASIHHPGDILRALVMLDTEGLFFQSVILDSEESAIEFPDENKATISQDLVDEINETMGNDAFICISSGAAESIAEIGSRYQEMQAKQVSLLAKLFLRLVSMESPALFGEDEMMQELLAELVDGTEENSQGWEEEFPTMPIPSLLAGYQPAEGEVEILLEKWRDMLQEAKEENQEGDFEKIKFSKYGFNFEGARFDLSQFILDAGEKMEAGIEAVDANASDLLDAQLADELGGKLAGQLEQELESVLGDALEEGVAEEAIDDMVDGAISRLKNRQLIIVAGEVDGRIIFFVGEGQDALVLEEKIEASLAAQPEFDCVGDGQLIGLCHVSKSLIDAFQSWRGYEKTYRALAQDFNEQKLPNSAEIVADFNRLADLEKDLLDRQSSDYLLALVIDDGLRIESVGGRRDVELDFSQPLRVPQLAVSLDHPPLITAAWRQNQHRQSMAMDQVELMAGLVGKIIEGGYLAFVEGSDLGAEWYEKSEQMYHEVVAPEVSRFWHAYRKLDHSALDGEVAWMIDLAGKIPQDDSIPAIYQMSGKVPRIVYLRPVRDRAAVSSSYEGFSQTAENVVDYLSIASESELSLPELDCEVNGGLSTWTYPVPLPMLTGDLVPHFSVSESLLMVGSSPPWAREIEQVWAQTSSSPGQEEVYGSVIELRFDVLWDYAENWIRLAELDQEVKAEVAVGAAEANLYKKETAQSGESDFDTQSARETLEWLRALESMRWHRREERGKARLSFHLKVAM